MLRNVTVILLIGTLLSCNPTSKMKEITEDAKISNRKFLVNDVPYIIKGICYHPVQKGKETRSFENLSEDLALMVEAGINTIRVYAPIIGTTYCWCGYFYLPYSLAHQIPIKH